MTEVLKNSFIFTNGLMCSKIKHENKLINLYIKGSCQFFYKKINIDSINNLTKNFDALLDAAKKYIIKSEYSEDVGLEGGKLLPVSLNIDSDWEKKQVWFELGKSGRMIAAQIIGDDFSSVYCDPP